jgi:hypothetical protein
VDQLVRFEVAGVLGSVFAVFEITYVRLIVGMHKPMCFHIRRVIGCTLALGASEFAQ